MKIATIMMIIMEMLADREIPQSCREIPLKPALESSRHNGQFRVVYVGNWNAPIVLSGDINCAGMSDIEACD